MMNLSVASWSFPACNLQEICGLASVLGIPAVDLGYFYNSALEKKRLLITPQEYANELKNKFPDNVFSNLYHLFGESLADRNLASASNQSENLKDFKQAVSFCREAEIPSIFILPGVINPGQTVQSALEQSIESLKPLVEAGVKQNLKVCIEPHVHSYMESPALVEECLEKVPGLKLALDYSHFICLGYRREEIDPLLKGAGHVHLRQAKPGELQTKFSEGTINFNALFGGLRQTGYNGFLALEAVHQDYMNTLFDDVLSETIKMRDAFRAWSI